VAALVGRVVHTLEAVDSTQAALGRMAREGAMEGTVVTARHQTAGRGRRGRSWWDAAGDSLLVSVLLRPAVAAAHVSELSLVAAVAVTDALDVLVGRPGHIRWPNDVLVDGAKICGILPEAAVDAAGQVSHVVLGIGLNVNQTAFPPELDGRATSLRLVSRTCRDPGAVLPVLLEALDRRYREWLGRGFAGMMEVWRRRAITLGQRVRTPDGRGGVAVDVDADGALLVDVGEGEPVRVLSGDAAADT